MDKNIKKNMRESNKDGFLPREKFVDDKHSQSGKNEYAGKDTSGSKQMSASKETSGSKDTSGSSTTRLNKIHREQQDEQRRADQEHFRAKNDMAGNTQGQVRAGQRGRTIGSSTKDNRQGNLQSDRTKQ